MFNENDKIEFKIEVNDSIVKEVIAKNGGTIFIGYEDDGTIYGISNARDELDKISNKLHDNIEPSVDFLVNHKIKNEDEKDVIVVQVLKGTSKPYYIKLKGMTPEGVYIWFGATAQHATKDSIRDMIIETSGVTFEKNLSVNQDLTFMYAEWIFQTKDLGFGKVEKKNLGIINDKDMYINLRLLISD